MRAAPLLPGVRVRTIRRGSKKSPQTQQARYHPEKGGKVVDVLPLKQTVIVQFEDGLQHEFSNIDLQPWDELEALRRKSQQPCDKHKSGGCNCNKSEAPTAAVAAGAEHTPEARPDQDEMHLAEDDLALPYSGEQTKPRHNPKNNQRRFKKKSKKKRSP